MRFIAALALLFVLANAQTFIVATLSSGPSGGEFAGIDDIKSSAFVNQYNGGKLYAQGTLSQNGCCAFYTADGYLGLDQQFLMPYTVFGTSACSRTSLPANMPVWFGTQHSYVGQLNNSAVNDLSGIEGKVPSFCSSSADDSWAIYKIGHNTPSPQGQVCLKADIQVTYSHPTMCYADAINYFLETGNFYQSIKLPTSGCHAYSVILHNVGVRYHNTTHFIFNTTGADHCPCSGWTYVKTSKDEVMQEVCETTADWGDCEIDVANEQPMECP